MWGTVRRTSRTPRGHELFAGSERARDQIIRWIESEMGITPITAPLGPGFDAYFITFRADDRARLMRQVELQRTLSGREFDGFDSQCYEALTKTSFHYLVALTTANDRRRPDRRVRLSGHFGEAI